MTSSTNEIVTYIETGKKRTFAGAVDWPGWCRRGKDESSALQALLDYAPRYARVLQGVGLDFQIPEDLSVFVMRERLEGSSSTDFGAPAAMPAADQGVMDQGEFERSGTLLQACWQAFDAVVAGAAGVELRKGPRGGGRDLEKIGRHVLEADHAYLRRLAWKWKKDKTADLNAQLDETRQAILDALQAAVNGELPERGPRGGVLWPPRYFVRRVAWHVLDHAWEIEDRA